MMRFIEFNDGIKRRIVVNADDYGHTERVTAAIIECFEKKLISQTTLLVNMPYADKAVQLAREKGLDSCVGLHLNFTEGRPLTESIRAYKNVCDDSGNFRRHVVGISEWNFEKCFAHAVEVEARAQMEKYLSYNLPLLHCDGHHHVHSRIGFAKIILPLLKEYGFVSVRNRYTLFPRHAFLKRLPDWLLKWLPGYFKDAQANRIFSGLLMRYDLNTTQGFGGWNGEALMKWDNFSDFELMVHPRYDEDGVNVNVLNFKHNMGPSMAYLKRLIVEFDNNRKKG